MKTDVSPLFLSTVCVEINGTVLCLWRKMKDYKIMRMINSMYNHNGNGTTKNKPVHVIMVLIGYVDIGDSIVNAHLCSLSKVLLFFTQI